MFQINVGISSIFLFYGDAIFEFEGVLAWQNSDVIHMVFS
jgi:hypothetical protein